MSSSSAPEIPQLGKMDIIEFVESAWGLGVKLFPVQRVVLKAHYGIPLDDTLKFEITDWRRENKRYFTEKTYLEYLFDTGRSNIREVVPGKELRNMVLAFGRRSGKTSISACIVAYEVYRLIHTYNPQKYYGVVPTNPINLISIATSKDQAGHLFQEASGHFAKCGFFKRYMARDTMTAIWFQSPAEIEKYGMYSDNPRARATIRVKFEPCNAKGLRGAGNYVVILDEVAHFVEVGSKSAEDVFNAVYPSTAAYSPKDENKKALRDQSDARVIMISSPLGKKGLFWDHFRRGMEGADNMLCIQAPTWEVNPTVAAGVFIDAHSVDPRQFDVEYGAEFSERTLGFFEEAKDVTDCIDPTLRPKLLGVSGRRYFMGFDLGLVVDASAMAIVHLEDGRIVTDFVDQIKAGEGEYRDRKRLEFDDVADWIHEQSRKFAIVEGIFDQWGGIPLEQALVKKGLTQIKTEHMTGQRNSEIYQNLKAMIFDRRLVLFDLNEEDRRRHHQETGKPAPEHAPYIMQLLGLQAEYKSKYVINVEAPKGQGKHDDLADALARAVWLASQAMGKASYIAGARSSTPISNGYTPNHMDMVKARLQGRLGGSHPMRMNPTRNPGLFNLYVKKYSSK